jgi:hypothetical protein
MDQSQLVGEDADSDKKRDTISVTVLVDGIPEPKVYRKDERIEAVIKSLLSEAERPHWDKWQLTDQRLGTDPLDPKLTLEEAHVKSGDILALNKKDGGGGA